MDGSVKFNVSPGVVSVIYFIILDLTFLTLFDFVFSRLAAYIYLKRIRKGKPLIVQSADIIGISTYLIGSYRLPINIVIYFLKLLLLASIIYIDLDINSNPVVSTSELTQSAIFNFDPSPKAWGNADLSRVVERPFELLRRCNYRNQRNDQIIYYALAFNLTNDKIGLESELDENFKKVRVNESTVQCLRKEKVIEEDEFPIAKVVGCSKYLTDTCRNETTVVIPNLDLPLYYANDPRYDFVKLNHAVIEIMYELRNYDQFITENRIFPSYENISMDCIRGGFGLQVNGGITYFEACIISSSHDNGKNTLIERWTYDRETKTLQRSFPGPVFEGILELSIVQKALAMQRVLSNADWVSFSSVIVANGAVYEKREMKVVTLRDTKMFTTVSWPALILVIILGSLAIICRILTFFFLSSDEIIQLNTIDGLSSIGREENEPTGRSFKIGKHMVIGLTNRASQRNVLHFGPMQKEDVGASRSADVVVK